MNTILTRRENGSFRSNRSVLFWYFLISRRATVPGLYRLFFSTRFVLSSQFQDFVQGQVTHALETEHSRGDFLPCFYGQCFVVEQDWLSVSSAVWAVPSLRPLSALYAWMSKARRDFEQSVPFGSCEARKEK